MNLLTQLICICLVINRSMQLSTPEDISYVAAVVEYDPNKSSDDPNNPGDAINRRIDEYVQLISTPVTDKTQDFDIIVFPESTLNTVEAPSNYPDQNAKITPCDDENFDDDLLRKISCAAKNNRRYVLINLTTKRNCTEEQIETNDPRECAENDINLYNTNVVFDRNGTIISVYRKFNLFESNVNSTLKPDFGTFNTDFNVTFGHFVCFDLLFKTPAVDLVLGERKIQNILFPTMWFSQLPFLSAVQIQQSWSYQLNVNFLSAGASNPVVGSTGTGIYSGRRGILKSIMTAIPETRLLIASVPKVPGGIIDGEILMVKKDETEEPPIEETKPIAEEVFAMHLTQDDIELYAKEWIDSKNFYGEQALEVCDNEFCCYFQIRLGKIIYQPYDPPEYLEYSYVAAAYSGRRNFTNGTPGGVRTCAVFACPTSVGGDINSCGTLYPVGTTTLNRFQFLKLDIAGIFPTKDILVMPNHINAMLMPLATKEFILISQVEPDAKNEIYHLSLLNPHRDLLTFAIYSRDFANDNSSSTRTSRLALLITMVIVTIISFKFL